MTRCSWKAAKKKYGVAVCSFESASVLHSLPLQIGDTVQILEEYSPDGENVTWLRGWKFDNKSKLGIFPAAFIQTKDCIVENEGPFEVVIPVEDAIIKELTFVLREWYAQWKSLFQDPSQKSLFQTILATMGELAKFRSALVSDTLTKEQAQELKHQVVTMTDWGNGQLGMDLVPRVAYQQADPENVSVVEMFRIHERSVLNCHRAGPGGMVKVKARERQAEESHHLLVRLATFACSVGDNAEVLFSLYDSSEGQFLSEPFVMYFNKDGQQDSSDKNTTIFSDLGTEDVHKDIYLVVQILRKGRLTTEGSFKKVPTYQYRRPWGVSVLSLKDLFQINPENELEYVLRVHCVENDNFYNMHEVLIKRQVQMTGKSSVTDKQVPSVCLRAKILHGDMKTVKVENPTLFNRGLVLTQRMGFPDIINPGEVRNDLYLTLIGAEFDRGSKTASKNVEVRVTVYNQSYEMIPGCILSANGNPMTSNFMSYVVYHNNSPKWNETIRLSIPFEKFSTAHIRLELCHCSNRDKAEKKLYGFGYLSVTTQDSITRADGKYDLWIYKCEDGAKIKNYLTLPCLRDDLISEKSPYHHSNKEFISVETLLCSSKFAQKAELLRVLQWSTIPARDIPERLDNLMSLKGHQLIRYLSDILDALFNMFSCGEGERAPFALNVFQALVHMFSLLREEMFEKFLVVLEDYLENTFSSPLAHRDMLHSLQEQSERIFTCTDFDEKSGKKVFKVLEEIFKFAVKSCLLYQRCYGNQVTKDFRDRLVEVFRAFSKILSSKEHVLRKSQAQLLNNLHKCFIPLLDIVSMVDLAQLVVFILNRITKEPGGSILRAKTVFIKNIINSQLMKDSTSREMLLPFCVAHLKSGFITRRHLDLTANTAGDLLCTVYSLKETCNISAEVMKVMQGLFDVVIRTLWWLSVDTEKHDKAVAGLLVSSLMEILRLMDGTHYQTLMSQYAKPEPLRDFLNRILLVFNKLVNSEPFPHDWTTMKMITYNVMLTAIHYIADNLTDNFLQGDNFDKELWFNFFLFAVDFITHPALQLKNYSQAKRSQIKDKYDDMRVPVGFHIHSLWNQLGPHKQHLMMDMIGPFLKVTMVPELELRKVTIPIFFDIMQCEFALKGHLRRIEGRMIQELDSLVIDHHGDEAYKMLLNSILMEKVQAVPDLQEEGKRFILSITDLLEKLLDYREIMDREEQRDTKMHCTFNILNFYKDSRRDMYIRYISRMYELHHSARNFVEAGLTLQLYAQLLSWSPTILLAEMAYPSQTEAERKEKLIHSILDCFSDGKAWEYGLPLCKELADYYEKTFQYKKLGQILQKQASFLYQILEGNKLRQNPTFYRVAYYGTTFPPLLKNKSFIYRGDECLKLSTIMNQLTTTFPAASILSTNSPLDDSFRQGEAQYIQIISVKPVPPARPEFAGKDVPNEISSFYNTNDVDTFQFDRAYHKGAKDPNNEFKTLCLERTKVETSYKLPGILRWYEVLNSQTTLLCPTQTAMDTVQQMNAELRLSVQNAVKYPEHYLRHLEMRLQGIITAFVGGGIPKYQEAFFNAEYSAKYPEEVVYIDQLRSLIIEQMDLLEKGLSVHGKHASLEMQPLHRTLVDTFIKMKCSMGYQNTPRNRGSMTSTGSASLRSGTPSSISVNSSERSSFGSGDANSIEEDVYIDPNEVDDSQSNSTSGILAAKDAVITELPRKNIVPSNVVPEFLKENSIAEPNIAPRSLSPLSHGLPKQPPPIPIRKQPQGMSTHSTSSNEGMNFSPPASGRGDPQLSPTSLYLTPTIPEDTTPRKEMSIKPALPPRHRGSDESNPETRSLPHSDHSTTVPPMNVANGATDPSILRPTVPASSHSTRKISCPPPLPSLSANAMPPKIPEKRPSLTPTRLNPPPLLKRSPSTPSGQQQQHQLPSPSVNEECAPPPIPRRKPSSSSS